mmetsp:Transcript_17316/g.49586  ORF Transcript_17316/g.49586 Transcript_17316/m.49586 type:complete len:114 (+) Transcript_17316:294-635(+)|eukprot:CAMPEP_0181027422 /NCGR_PEP_ID=MMETSP1070-20121207/4156_1 /TAXON_ID=265543 /ORGANISM="Minutocellus polymorphus, Strain NH13" /LENGTH=113 /DNA_ID=CAMNT_0023104663 /DNA_START=287 /DNA_END=628 /DNA_ORIENTATION=+
MSSSTSDDASSTGGNALMEMLTANAQIVKAAKPGDASNSQCAKQCQSEQAAIVSCIESIRAARESSDATGSNSGESDPTHTAGKVDCLAPVVAAWTKCCSDANNDGATDDAAD